MCALDTGRLKLLCDFPIVSPKFSFPKLIFGFIALRVGASNCAGNVFPSTSNDMLKIVTVLFCTKVTKRISIAYSVLYPSRLSSN